MADKTYQHFKIVETGELHDRPYYMVFSLHNKGELGLIEYYPRWQEYVFRPNPGTIFSQDCLDDISDFIRNLKEG